MQAQHLHSQVSTGKHLSLLEAYKNTRKTTEKLCQDLHDEDYTLQTSEEVSPTKWHLGHTSWFFEAFIVKKHNPQYKPHHEFYDFLFNSYYKSHGKHLQRGLRGIISRPTIGEIYKFRHRIDEEIAGLYQTHADNPGFQTLLETGINHEQQHQELFLTDIRYNFAQNPLHPIFDASAHTKRTIPPPPIEWRKIPEGVYTIGHTGKSFAFDNEKPRHKQFLYSFEIAKRPITNGEYLKFIEDKGYQNPRLWLSDAFEKIEAEKWQAPLYWRREEDGWHNFTLHGYKAIDPNEAVANISYYEAEAFARWAGHRLPTEAEWEVSTQDLAITGHFLEEHIYQPIIKATDPSHQMFGTLWEWTSSPYTPYPNFQAFTGTLGEYNGKFMCNQFVLRGGSWATPKAHIRRSCRNFFPPSTRWQNTGIRLAKARRGVP